MLAFTSSIVSQPGAADQSANRFPAGPAINLGRSADVKLRIDLKGQLAVKVVIDFAAADSQLRLVLKMLETVSK